MPVNYEASNRVAVITFDDGKANALNHETLADLDSALERAAQDREVGCVVLAGRPGRFSAGFDLPTMTGSPEGMRALVAVGGQFVARLLLFPKPVVAACTGHALAAGALILLASDHRIGPTGEWKIGLNEVAIGMPLPKWALAVAQYRLRPSELDWRALLGQVAGPEEAVAAGFLDRVVPPEEVVGEALKTAADLANLRTAAVDGTKRRLRGPLAVRMLEGMDEDLAETEVPRPS
jgi:enoyl-CoA hydratase